MYLFYKLSKCILIYFISAAVILLVSLAAKGQLSLSYNKAGRASVLYSIILLVFKVFCGLNITVYTACYFQIAIIFVININFFFIRHKTS